MKSGLVSRTRRIMPEPTRQPEQSWDRDRTEKSRRDRATVAAGGWWHSIELADGIVTPGINSLERLRAKYRSFGLPDNLSGRRVLDVGCWDGFHSFEAEQHGAAVVSIDCFRPENYFTAHVALHSRAQFHEMSVYELDRKQLGTFEVVLFLGVLYHLRHPLLGLERICNLTTDVAIIESHVTEEFVGSSRPLMEFYETGELVGQYDNWWSPNLECLMRMVRSSGFAFVELLWGWDEGFATVKAHRTWQPNPNLEAVPSIVLTDIFNPVTWKKEIPVTGRHAFVGMYAEGLSDLPHRESVRLHIGPFGIVPHFVGESQYPGCAQINAAVPPGLDPGLAAVWIEVGNRRSNEAHAHLVEGQTW